MTAPDESRKVADDIRARHSLGDDVHAFTTGSVPVFGAGTNSVIKLFPADEAHHFDAEVAALRCLHGRPSVPTPRLIDAGEYGGWLYVAMTRLTGRSLDDAWNDLDADTRRTLMHAVGVAIRELHAVVPAPREPFALDWGKFISEQALSCRARHQEKGLRSPWLEAIDDFVARWMPLDDGTRVLLHTEIMREHILVDETEGQWRLSGLIDFEPAVLGAPEYEFAAVGIYLTGAEPGLMSEVLRGYGVDMAAVPPQRLLVHTLLHRYGNLRRYLEFLPVSGRPGDLDTLAGTWFR
ncbi:MAG: aminoglycoside 3'-phosphotransferase/choline kinase family protein [Vicinamibacterales bacterium]